ncbi:MAG: glycosyltransferase [Actinomycetes bacterium]
MPTPRLSVVIPTRNRADDLRACLAALVPQLPESAQLTVANDGSTDHTQEVLDSFPRAKVLSLSGAGASAARNAALTVSTGEIVLFLDDDVVATPGLVERHLDFHLQNPLVESALVGLVTWDPRRKITGHMVWLEDGGPLFSFNTIADRRSVDPRHFCTANVSLKRKLLERVSGPFNVQLPRFTDVELALRLAKVGMNLSYDENAVGWHLRADTPASTDARMFVVGQASVLLEEIHPGMAPEAASLGRVRHAKVLFAKALTPICESLPSRVAGRVWSARAAWAYAAGRADAISAKASRG